MGLGSRLHFVIFTGVINKGYIKLRECKVIFLRVNVYWLRLKVLRVPHFVETYSTCFQTGKEDEPVISPRTI